MIGKSIKTLNSRYLRFKHPLDLYPAGFDRHKCIFFHIPKAAGTSICMSLFGYQIGHLNFEKMYLSNPYKAQTYFKFSFVRNPWDRLVSAYHFLSTGGMNTTDKAWMEKNLPNYDGFKDFVKGWVNQDSVNTYMHFIPQHKFISDRNGIVRADFVGKTENFQKDFEIISSTLNIQSELMHENKSNHKSYTDYYDDMTRDIVTSVYAKDIELFGYRFGD